MVETTTNIYEVCGSPVVCPNYTQCLGVSLPVRFIDCLSSTNDIIDADVKIYPNPARDFIDVSIQRKLIGSNYLIVDQLGREIKSNTLRNVTTRINIDELSSGIFLLIIEDKNPKIFTIYKE